MELSKLEIERDYYKRESEGKEQIIQQYQHELIQYKTKLRQYTSSQHRQSLEDETTQLKEQLKVKEAELKQKHDQDLQKKLEAKETELKQKYDQNLQIKLEDKETELKQKYDQYLQMKLEYKEAELKQKHDQDIQMKLEYKETELKQKHDQDLQMKLEYKEAELKQKTFRIKFIQDELNKKDVTILEKDNELKNKEVQEGIYLQRIQDLSKETVQTVSHAAIGIENERKEVKQKLETEEISKLKEEIKILEEKLKQQVGKCIMHNFK